MKRRRMRIEAPPPIPEGMMYLKWRLEPISKVERLANLSIMLQKNYSYKDDPAYNWRRQGPRKSR